MKKINTNEIGDFGEDYAARYLIDNGYIILERNFRLKMGEIDIIASKGERIIFVEVKTRKNNYFGEPSEYVNAKKIHHIRNTALAYTSSLDTDMRFDVIEIIYAVEQGRFTVKNLNHIKDAF